MAANPVDIDRLASEIAPRRLLTPAGTQLLTSNCTASEYLDALIERGLTADGIRFLSAWLPPRQAIWWGCLCLQMSADAETQLVDELAALGAIAQWVVNPEKPCQAAAPGTIPSKAAARLARAAHAASDKKTPADVMVPAQVSAAVIGTAALAPPREAIVRQRLFLALGMHIAQGKYCWNEPERS
jgi:hypothetical protein